MTAASMMVSVVVAFHSVNGRTAVIAEAIRAGVDSEEAALATVVDVSSPPHPWATLHAADAIVFGCPTHFGNVSAGMKAFHDATLPLWRQMRWRDKLAAGFTCGSAPSGDKQSTLLALAVFAAQQGMVWIGMDYMEDVRTGRGKPEGYNRHGSGMGLMADAEGDTVTETSPPATDRMTARLFGKRIACATRRWVRGRDSR